MYWNVIESTDPDKVNDRHIEAYWFWGFMRNTKRIVEVAEKKKIDFFFIDHAYLYHQRHSMFEKYGDMNNCLFRVVKNNYVIDKITDTNDNRLLHLKARFAKDDELDKFLAMDDIAYNHAKAHFEAAYTLLEKGKNTKENKIGTAESYNYTLKSLAQFSEEKKKTSIHKLTFNYF